MGGNGRSSYLEAGGYGDNALIAASLEVNPLTIRRIPALVFKHALRRSKAQGLAISRR